MTEKAIINKTPIIGIINKSPMITSSQKNSFAIYYDGVFIILDPDSFIDPTQLIDSAVYTKFK
jgi:hypothetical protein